MPALMLRVTGSSTWLTEWLSSECCSSSVLHLLRCSSAHLRTSDAMVYWQQSDCILLRLLLRPVCAVTTLGLHDTDSSNRLQVDGGTPHEAAREAAAAADVGPGAATDGAEAAATIPRVPETDAAAPSSNGDVVAGKGSSGLCLRVEVRS